MEEEGEPGEGMMTQASQIWSMLDDMATSNPQAYRKFIDKHVKEGKEFYKPPEPHMCVMSRVMEPKAQSLYVNVFAWTRIPKLKNDEDPIPVMGGPLQTMKDEKGEHRVVTVAFNPDVLERFGRDSNLTEERRMLINLAFDYAEDQHKIKVSRSYTILPNDKTHVGNLAELCAIFTRKTQKHDEKFEQDLGDLQKSFGPLSGVGKDSLLNKLSSLSADDKPDFSVLSPAEPNKMNGKKADIRIGTESREKKKGLIQEINNENEKKKVVEPSYEMHINEGEGSHDRKVVLKVKLPGVKSVGDCELDISEADIQFKVPDMYELKVKFPEKVLDSQAAAKFSKKSSTLTVTVPISNTR